MKTIHKLFVLLLVVYSINGIAQTKDYCKRCNMLIKDELHKASAIEDGKQLTFDAIECLVNYLKTDEKDLSQKQVADYSNGEMVEAESAFYLKSKAIPSPMGAYLSAFKTKEAAQKMKEKKGGEVYNWEELKARFADSDFGSLNAGHHHHNRADAHAPLGVMGDHLHHKGGLMVSFRYMNMLMQGNRAGQSTIEDEAIYKDYMVAPQQMQMDMYMLGVMYAPSNKLTLMYMQSFMQNRMDLTAQMKMGGMMMNGMTMESKVMQTDFETASSGFGDAKIAAMYGLVNNEQTSFHLNAKLNLPLGSIEESDDTPMKESARLPYRMQLGSGTFDYSLGGTYKMHGDQLSAGCQLMATARSGENDQGYRWGSQLQLNVWGAYLVSSSLSVSARLYGLAEGQIEGKDDELKPMIIPAANVKNYGGESIHSFVGLNYAFAQESKLRKMRLGAEAGYPVYQNLSGIQMNQGPVINLGVKYNLL